MHRTYNVCYRSPIGAIEWVYGVHAGTKAAAARYGRHTLVKKFGAERAASFRFIDAVFAGGLGA